MIVDIGIYYSNHFTVAETASSIFSAMASEVTIKATDLKENLRKHYILSMKDLL